MIAYKLMRRRKDGTLGPLFINRKSKVPVGEWLEAEDHPTKGYAHRPGWHCTFTPWAPHLKRKDGSFAPDRVWAVIEVEDFHSYSRPESQGGSWILARRIKVFDVFTPDELIKLQTNLLGGIANV
jgi:hypothetical protein